MARTVRIAYIPLDDRPVNLDAVLQLARVGGVELLLPPQELLGTYTTPGDPGALERWLVTLPRELSHLVVSLDMIGHGGLLASRTPPREGEEPPAGRAARALGMLSALKAERPNLAILGAGVLLRSAISVLGRADLELWRTIHDVATTPGATRDTVGPAMQRAGVPREQIDAYLGTRARNLAFHHAALELVQNGVIDYLLLCQEDSAPDGIHREEQVLLEERIELDALGPKVSIQPGADEAGMLLVARAALREHRIGLAVLPEFGPGGPGAIPPYESCSIAESLRSKLATLGAKRGFGTRLYLHVLEGASADLFLEQDRGAAFEGGCPPSVDVRAGWAVADLSVANGADTAFVRSLLARARPLSLAAFAAWNTASNSLGTVLAHLAMREIGLGVLDGREAAQRHLELLATRWADDYLYQSIVRERLLAACRAEGLDPFALGPGGHERMQELLAREMGAEFDRFAAEHAVGRDAAGFRVKSLHGRFTLPWPRLFEVRARVRVELA